MPILKTVIFMGSSRAMAPPWDPTTTRLGTRVLEHVKSTLLARNEVVGTGTDRVSHDLTVYDPLEVFAEGGALAASGAEVKQPHFFYKAGSAPPAMEAMRQTILAADSYVIVTAEYNHNVPPALLAMLDHFGGSNFSGKPSGIVTYSMGPYGGSRASMAIQPVLHELGCLPVSKMVAFASASELFKADGTPVDPKHRMLGQLPGMLSQLEWMGVAMKAQREATGLWK